MVENHANSISDFQALIMNHLWPSTQEVCAYLLCLRIRQCHSVVTARVVFIQDRCVSCQSIRTLNDTYENDYADKNINDLLSVLSWCL